MGYVSQLQPLNLMHVNTMSHYQCVKHYKHKIIPISNINHNVVTTQALKQNMKCAK